MKNIFGMTLVLIASSFWMSLVPAYAADAAAPADAIADLQLCAQSAVASLFAEGDASAKVAVDLIVGICVEKSTRLGVEPIVRGESSWMESSDLFKGLNIPWDGVTSQYRISEIQLRHLVGWRRGLERELKVALEGMDDVDPRNLLGPDARRLAEAKQTIREIAGLAAKRPVAFVGHAEPSDCEHASSDAQSSALSQCLSAGYKDCVLKGGVVYSLHDEDNGTRLCEKAAVYQGTQR